MTNVQKAQLENTIGSLHSDSKNDYLRIAKGLVKSVFRPIEPHDFKNAYLAISKEQGQDLIRLIKAKNIKNIVEFGTSFGISTLYLAQGIAETGGHIITTELIESKAKQAIENFKAAGVHDLIEVRVGDALETLKAHDQAIDLLLLDGWKNLYLPLFRMLENNFHADTIIYVDNADMPEVQTFLSVVDRATNYVVQSHFQGKVSIITKK